MFFYINGLSEEKAHKHKIGLDIEKCNYVGFDRTGNWTEKLYENGGTIMGEKVSIFVSHGTLPKIKKNSS